MKDSDRFDQFPQKRIKPFDGMSVTADVWEQTQGEHRQSLLAHTAVLHGAGILAGLEIVANDPPNRHVFISPGAAIDQAGHIIIVSKTLAYDFGDSAEGQLYLMIAHGEREMGGMDAEIRYVQSECVIAARPALPKRPAVELARVTISHAKSTICNAPDAMHPAQNELDLRFRAQVALPTLRRLRAAVGYLGARQAAALAGWDQLARACQSDAQYRLAVDECMELSEALAGYDLVYLACSGSFEAGATTLEVLKGCLDAGVPLVLEALDEAAEAACQRLLDALERAVAPLEEGHPLMRSPHFFARLPAGSRGCQVAVAPGLVYASAGYSLAWSGQMEGALGSRSQIRDACEWGLNLLQYCAQRGGPG